MYIEFKGKRENEQKGMIQTFYDSFDDLFHLQFNKKLVRNRFEPDHEKPYILETIQSFIDNGEVACDHSWGRNGYFIFQIDLFYFDYKDRIYSVGFQFQNSTAKINCARVPYRNSFPSGIKDIKPIFVKAFHNNEIFTNRVGYPRAHAYISITKKDDNLLKLNTKKLCVKLFGLLKESSDLLIDIRQDIKSIGGKFKKYHAII
jgi:hypothetical protein